MSITFPNVVTHRKFSKLTSALASTVIYERALGAQSALIRVDVYIQQESGSTGSVSAAVTYFNGVGATNPALNVPACTAVASPSSLSAPIHMNEDSAISINTTIVSGSPTYSVEVVLTSLTSD